jgi:hypothetical protein
MERAEERNELLPSRVIARELHRGFHGLGSRVAEVHASLGAAGSQCCELLGELHHVLVIKIRAGHVEQLSRLLTNGCYDSRMTVACGNDRDTGVEIEKTVAVHVLNDCALAAMDDQRVRPCVRRRQYGLIALDDPLRDGAGQRRYEFWQIPPSGGSTHGNTPPCGLHRV